VTRIWTKQEKSVHDSSAPFIAVLVVTCCSSRWFSCFHHCAPLRHAMWYWCCTLKLSNATSYPNNTV
jgi:hypothetical protein